VRVGGADVPCGRAKVMAPRAERVGIFFARTLEESAATRLAKLDHFSDFLSKISESERRDGLTTSQVGPIPSGNLFGPFERELDCARGGLKIKKRSYNSADAFHRGIRGDSYENDSFSGLNASDSTVKPPTDGSARHAELARHALGSRSAHALLSSFAGTSRTHGKKVLLFGDKAR
jgi:hypothetical protein